MHLRLPLAVAALAMVGVAVAALLLFRPAPNDATSPSDHPPMRVATYYWPGMYWIDIARTKGWFEEARLDVEFVDVNDDYYAGLDMLQQGAVDTLAVWLFDVIKRDQQGAGLIMVLATDVSNGSEALVGGAHIDSVQKLEGRRIGVPKGTALVYELNVMLGRFGLMLKDVTLVDIDAEHAGDKLEQGAVDAVITWEPYASQAVEQGGRRLYDTSKLPGLITAGMTFRESFLQRRPEDVQRLVEVWQRTTGYIRSNRAAAFETIAEIYDVKPESVAAFAESNRIMALRDNIQAFTYASGLESLFGSARKINRFLLDRAEMGGTPVQGEDVLDGRFVRQLARQQAAR